MWRFTLSVFAGVILTLLLDAQPVPMHPILIEKDYFHDSSPALRAMPMLNPVFDTLRWKEGSIPNNPFPFDRKEQNRYLKSDNSKDPVIQDKMGDLSPVNTLLNFDGICGTGGCVPPDPNGAVGLNHYIQTVNTSFAIYSKSGDLVYGPASLGTIWQGFPGYHGSDGDPIVLYDHLANRWFISQFALPNYPNGPYYESIAISQTDDPLGSWYRYSFKFVDMPDYPKFGIWPDGYYFSANSFTPGALNWKGPLAGVIERDSMLTGNNARIVFFQLGNEMNSMIPADLDGPPPPLGSNGYFLMAGDNTGGDSINQISLYTLHSDWTDTSNIVLTGPHLILTAPYDMSVEEIPQMGSSRRLDALSNYLMNRLEYRNFGSYQSLLVNHTVDGDGTDHAGVRWYELRKAGNYWTVYQQGTYIPDNLHRWMASTAMDGNGNIAMGYSISGDTIFPSIGITGRHIGDIPGHLTCIEEMVMKGSGSQTGVSRWGDYSSLSIDPSDDATFWYTNEYYPISSYDKWSTRICSFTINDLQVGLNNPSLASDTKRILKPNYPNPFSQHTTLRWSLTEPSKVNLQIIDITGKIVSVPVDEYCNAGNYFIDFDAANLNNGIYFCQLMVNNIRESQKLILIK